MTAPPPPARVGSVDLGEAGCNPCQHFFGDRTLRLGLDFLEAHALDVRVVLARLEIGQLGDDNSDSTTIMKTSWDGGRSWTSFQTITPTGAAGYSCSHGIYDRQRDRVVVQYTRFPTNTTRPASS